MEDEAKTSGQILSELRSLRDGLAVLENSGEEIERARLAYKQQVDRYGALMEQSRDGIVLLDHNGKVVESNRAFSEMLKYSTEEIAQMHVWDWDAKMTRKELDEAVRTIGPQGDHFTTLHRRKDGSVFDVEITSTATEWDGQKLILCACRDITDKLKADKALKQSEERLALAIETTRVGMFDWDVLSGNSFWSKQYEKIMGYPSTEADSRSYEKWAERVHPEDLPWVEEEVNRAMAARRLYRAEYRIVRPNGEILWVEGRGAFVFDSEGRATRMLGTVWDITERRRAEEEKEALIEFLRLVNESKNLDEFVRCAVEFFRRHSECDAVGIRLKRECDYPYYETRGFPEAFVLLENKLCALDGEGRPILDSLGDPVLECMCGNVTAGRFDPTKSFFTEKGSFWTNSTTELLASSTESDRQVRTRNRCNGEGYESVALIPLRFGDERLGLIQLNDRQKGRFTAERMTFWERLADYAAVALSKFTAEDALRRSEEDFKTLFEMASIGMAEADPDTGAFLRVNRKMSEITGYSAGELLEMKFPDITHPEDRQLDFESFRNVISGQSGGCNREKRYVRKDGRAVWVNVNMAVIRNADGRRRRAMATVEDIDDRKHAEEALRQGETQLRQIIDLVPHMIFVKDWDGNYVLVNKAVAEGYNMSVANLIGKSHGDLHPNEDELLRMLRDDREVMAGGKIKVIGEERYTDSDGKVRFLHTTKVPFNALDRENRAVLGIAIDITESKQAEEEREKLREQLNQALKMESVGRLAGGVAHDFNNMLGIILGHIEMAMEEVDSSQPIYHNLQEIKKAAERSANLTRQLLAFARKQTVVPKVLDINEIVQGMLKMLRRLIGEDIDLAWSPGCNLWRVKMDPSQVDQILANLCVNARDAIAGVGKLAIETRNAVLDKAYCAEHIGAAEGDYVLLAVNDNGCGMEKEVLERIFEPFFTTKEVGKGTGLGLATIYGIVKQNQGYIDVRSAPEEGTSFRIYLPRHKVEPNHEKKDAPVNSAGKRSTILLVEDEPGMLNMTKAMLERLGHRVLAAGKPGEALNIAEAHSGEIHILMTDVVMPEMNGRDLAGRIQSMHPRMKCLFMSGYTEDLIAHHGVLEPGVNFINKPFSMDGLSLKLRNTLATGDRLTPKVAGC